MINAERVVRDVVVIGASAGGLLPLITLLGSLPQAFAAAVGVVVHLSAAYESRLASVLARRATVPIVESEHEMPFKPGRVHIAPADQHMTLEDQALRLIRGPKEHRMRPAINPLFVSAAKMFGPRVVGVLLSGSGSDGVAGLIAIKAGGGLSLVQRPAEAAFPSMPRTAIREDDVDAVLGQDELGRALVVLAAGAELEATEIVR